MKKLSIKTIIKFRNKPEKSKKNFVNAFKVEKPVVKTEGGGDYWIICLSAISNSFKSGDLQNILDKKDEVAEKFREEAKTLTKNMYQRNMTILNNYKDYEIKKWRPKEIELVSKNKDHSVLTLKGLEIQVTPQHVFKMKKNDTEEIGAIWFIAKLGGFKKDELGMFADILYRYLRTHHAKTYSINPKYCIAVDVFNKIDISYLHLEEGRVASVLNATLDEIKKLI